MIEFSRHAKRRMQLYGISEENVLTAINEGKKEILANGKIVFVHDFQLKLRYPIKVVALQKERGTLIITTYPLKRRQE
jgi:hypothetical protein